MKRIFAILMACLFMVALMVVMAMPAFADPKGGNFKPGPANPDNNFANPHDGGRNGGCGQ